MSISSHSRSNETPVVSKFFVDGTYSMDESVSDFQEPKRNCKGPKSVQSNKNTVKGKPKPKKKIRGQKDIRQVLKKNEIIEYTKDFNNICKESGLDVDAEQLQLAIALSKSVQDTKNEQNEASMSECLTSGQRNAKIRTTLEEYGFKVPEKPKPTGGRRLKKIKNNSKLLLITKEERQQLIADRYTQVVFTNISYSKSVLEDMNCNHSLYHISTNSSYQSLKYNGTFYVKSLPISVSDTTGSLLRDWSEIPGRPVSPNKTRHCKYKTVELDFSQIEMDTILSGSLEKAQKIVDGKVVYAKDSEKFNEIIEIDIDDRELEVNENKIRHLNYCIDILPKPTVNKEVVRSLSPDLFDEDLSLADNSKDIIPNSQEPLLIQETRNTLIVNNVTRKKSNDFMDLTECVNVPSTSGNEMVITKTYDLTVSDCQKSIINCTKILSQDLMEMTDCVALLSQRKISAINVDIDLTQNSEDADSTIILEDHEGTVKKVDVVKMDLTQSSNSNDDTLPFVQISGHVQKSTEYELIDLKPNEEDNVNNFHESEVTNKPDIVIVQSPECIQLDINTPTKARISKSSRASSNFDEFLFEHSSNESLKASVNLTQTSAKEYASQEPEQVNDIDLTQTSNSSVISNCIETVNHNDLGKIDDVSIDYDEILVVQETSQDINKEESTNQFDEYRETNKEDDKINTDLITRINSNEHLNVESQNTQSTNEQEIFEISDEELNYSVHKSKHFDCSQAYDLPEDNPNIDFGGISMMDNISNIDHSVNTITKSALTESKNDSYLPDVEIKGTKVKLKSPLKIGDTDVSTPIRHIFQRDVNMIRTPTNREYIVKTNQVTPMVDYASLTTPERNMELEKYGLKPFKRKRAIQLLTHLYNQTHPVVERFADDMPSPSKKRKADNTETPTSKFTHEESTEIVPGTSKIDELESNVVKSPANNLMSKSPAKNIKTPTKSIKIPTKSVKTPNISVKTPTKSVEELEDRLVNVVYPVNRVNPQSIRAVDCDPEDWVFQKREKAKLHSCRVPLHIAFHNYVSCSSALREAILRYEPVSIDVIHRNLVEQGHRYDPKDLLRFLDKKCITVKTADNNTRNNVKKGQRKS